MMRQYEQSSNSNKKREDKQIAKQRSQFSKNQSFHSREQLLLQQQQEY